LRGFGDPRTGASPYADWPAFDVTAQAMGGIMGITGPDAETPVKTGPGVGDIVPGMFLAFGVVSAVHHARNTGQGQYVDVSMLDGVLSLCERIVFQYTYEGAVGRPEGNKHPYLCPFGVFPAKDGCVTIAAPRQAFFERLCERLDVPELASDPRFSSDTQRVRNQKELVPLLDRITERFTKAELMTRLGGQVPFGPVMHMDEIARDPHFRAREMIVPIDQPGSSKKTAVAGVPVKMTETPGGIHKRAPFLGEHAEEILKAAGLSPQEIAEVASEPAPNGR
jgi:crotonobetainyl-CoA:carnitine CoA-transferase CaiB-like acyl-CoA transferase